MPSLPLLTPVYARFFTEDILALKQQAREAGELNWQPRLRMLVRMALRDARLKKGVIK